jgi:hypothetical protein
MDEGEATQIRPQNEPKDPSKREFLKNAGKVFGFAALATATPLAGKIGIDTLRSYFSGGEKPPFRSYSPDNVPGIENWARKIQEQLSNGPVTLTGLDINVEGGTLNLRHTPTIVEHDRSEATNLAIEINEGSFRVDDAVIIKGDNIDPNDPNGDQWALVSGSYFGRNNPIYISLSRQTKDYVKRDVKPRNADSARWDDQGNLFIKQGQSETLAKTQITPVQTQPAK